MIPPFARLASLLDLDRPLPGERTAWTVRSAHGVHTVHLELAITGTQVSVDGEVVGRSSAWSFSDQPFRFQVGGAPAILAISPDTGRGTERASLLVAGEPVAQDAPTWRRSRDRPIGWGPILARGSYLTAGALILSAAAGDPLFGMVSAALDTAAEVAWFAVLRAVDWTGLLPAWVHALTASRAGMLLAGIELLLLVALARHRRLRDRLPALSSPSRARRAAGWIALVLAAALPPVLLDS